MARQRYAPEVGVEQAWAPSARGDFAAVKNAHGKVSFRQRTIILTGCPRNDRRVVASDGSSFGTGAVDRTGKPRDGS